MNSYEELRAQYYELIMAVERCFPGESRHETALRYIREAEARANQGEGEQEHGSEVGAGVDTAGVGARTRDT
jgi:hypothetical protein